MSQQILEQMVRKVTRGHKVLVVFLTNCPHLWKPPVALNGLVLSDHLAVMVAPRIAARPDRSIVYFRWEHREIETEHKLDTGVWSNLLSCDNITKAIHLLDNALTGIFNECFSLVKVKVSSWDPLVCRHWLNTCVPSGSIRNRNTRKYCAVNADLQARINELTRNNQCKCRLYAMEIENMELGLRVGGIL